MERHVIKINAKGCARVLNGMVGMTFIVDKFTAGRAGFGMVAHVRDYRYPGNRRLFQIWSINSYGYDIVVDDQGEPVCPISGLPERIFSGPTEGK